MRLVKAIVAFAAVCISLSACSYFGGDSVTPLCEVGDASLYEDEVWNALGDCSDYDGEDSIRAVNAYVKNWAIQELLYAEANRTVTDMAEIDLLVEKYKRSLMIYEYQLQLIRQNLSSPVTMTELQKFYDENRELYVAHETLFQGLMITVPKSIPAALQELRATLRQSELQMDNVEQLISRYALKCNYFDDKWTPVAAAVRLGMSNLNLNQDFGRMKYVEENDGDQTYILVVQDFIKAGGVQPFEYVRERVQNMMAETRKANYLKTANEEIYNKGVMSGAVKRFDLTNDNKK